jgi:hypothetical protein
VTTNQAHTLLHEDENFVYSKRFGYSLQKVLERYPEAAPDRVTAGLLMITEDDVETHWQGIVRKLRDRMGVDISL